MQFCNHKQVYKTKKEAYQMISYLMEDSFDGIIPLRVYKCKMCKGWHLTKEK